MSKKVLILSGSPRKGGNSDLLCDEFLRGALEAGNTAEKIHIPSCKLAYCSGCGHCYMNKTDCVHGDDMTEIIQKMIDADAIVMATPVYFYAMSGQMKVMIDRTISRFLEIRSKDIYFILAAHDTSRENMEKVLAGFRGFLACLPEAKEKGTIYGLGVFGAGDIKGAPAMGQAYEMGKSV
ncbi:MAG: flavodoxin family protein [Oscillospiraceae bacterium]|nr:flavodoxin family protein [Oscillospiraceae bacterium]